MAPALNFRNALNGFNRTDVVQFIQNQTMEHEKALRLLREENARLQEDLDTAQAALQEMQVALDAAQTAPVVSPVAELQSIAEEPALPLDAPMAPAASVVAVAPSDFNELELAAYRRAEMTERMAKERAAASAQRMKAVFAQADEKLSLTAQDFTTLLDTFQHDFEQMQQLLLTAQGIVNESSAGLKTASEICSEP